MPFSDEEVSRQLAAHRAIAKHNRSPVISLTFADFKLKVELIMKRARKILFGRIPPDHVAARYVDEMFNLLTFQKRTNDTYQIQEYMKGEDWEKKTNLIYKSLEKLIIAKDRCPHFTRDCMQLVDSLQHNARQFADIQF